MLEALKQLIPDNVNLKGNDFMSGNPTTAFNKVKETTSEIQNQGKELASELTTTAGALVSAVNVVSLSADQLSQIAQSMAAASIEEITKFTGSKISEFTTKSTSLVTSIPGKIASDSLNKFNSSDKKESIGDVVARLGDDYEKLLEKDFEKSNEKLQTEKIDEFKKSATETITKAKEFVQQANDQIYKIMGYAAEGPAYIAQQMSHLIESNKENIDKVLNDQYKKVEDSINLFCDGESSKIAEKLVQEYNSTIEKTAKQIHNTQEIAKTKLQVTGNTSTLENLLKLFGKIGV